MPTLIPGNLLDLNTQEIEVDTSGWTPTNATLTRTFARMANPYDDWIMVAASTGTAPVTVTTAAAVTLPNAEAEYLGYCYVWVPASRTSDITITIHWLDGSAAEIGTTSNSLALPGGQVRGLNVVGVPLVGAVSARMSMTSTGTAAGDQTVFDVMYLGIAPNHAGNLLDYNTYSVEVDDAGWSAPGATVAQVPAMHTGGEGRYLLQITPTGPGIIEIENPTLIPVIPGERYQWGASMWTYAGDPPDPNATVTGDVQAVWCDSEGADIGPSDAPSWFTVPATSVYPGLFTSEAAKAPEGAAYAKLRVLIRHESTTAPNYTADQFWFIHTEETYSIEVNDNTGSVLLTVNYVPLVETNLFSLYRVHPDGSRYPVRGYGGDWEDRPVPPMPLVVEDYECPMGIRVWYTAIWYNSETVSRSEIPTSVLMGPTLADPGEAWIKSPGIPALNRRVTMAAPVAWSRRARAGVHEILDRASPVVVTGARASAEGAISLHVWEADDHDALNALMDSGMPVLLQAMPGHGLPGNVYLFIGDISTEPLSWNAAVPGWRWSLAVRQIDRPTGGLAGSATRTWQDIFDEFETWDDVAMTYATWADLLIDRRL